MCYLFQVAVPAALPSKASPGIIEIYYQVTWGV